MVRGIAQSVVSGLLILFGAGCVVSAVLYFFFPKLRPWILSAGAFLVLFVASLYLRNFIPETDKMSGVVELEAPAIIDGLPLQDRYTREPDGRLLTGILSKDHEVQGWPAKGGTRVSFDPWGGLMMWTSSREVDVWGKHWPAGTTFTGMMARGEEMIVNPLDGAEAVTLHRKRP